MADFDEDEVDFSPPEEVEEDSLVEFPMRFVLEVLDVNIQRMLAVTCDLFAQAVEFGVFRRIVASVCFGRE